MYNKKFRSISLNDELLSIHNNSNASSIPISPKFIIFISNLSKFIFKKRAITLSSALEREMRIETTKTRTTTVRTEISNELAQIGDEILTMYGEALGKKIGILLMGSTCTTTKLKRDKENETTEKSSKRRKISGLLGQIMIHIATQY